MQSDYLLLIIALIILGVSLLLYLVRDQRHARKERQALARDVAELRAQLRERYGHERAEELLHAAGAPQQRAPEDEPRGRRHLKAVPPLAIVGAAGEWAREHPVVSTVGVVGLAAALALTASAPLSGNKHAPPIALPAPSGTLPPPTPTAPTTTPAPPPTAPHGTAGAPSSGPADVAQPAGHGQASARATPPPSTPATAPAPTGGSSPATSAPAPPSSSAPSCGGIGVDLRPIVGLCLLG